jgi:Tfp pilus assembly protein PilN
LPFVALAVLGYSLSYVSGRTFLIVAVAVMTCESMIFFTLPSFRSPSSITVASGSIDYLEQHQGLNRFVSLGVLTPNWGTQYGLNEINAVDLPLPTSFTNYINTSLAPSLGNPRLYTLPFTVASEDELAAHIANYESLGVEYLLVPRKPLAPSLLALGLTPLVADAHSELFRIPHAANFYATALTTCVVSNATVDHVSVDCPSATTLTRLELFMTGWTARVNGVATTITTTNGLNQTINLPAGLSTVTYGFLPAHEEAAGALAVVAFVVMAATWLPFARRRRKNSSVAPTDDETADTTNVDEDVDGDVAADSTAMTITEELNGKSSSTTHEVLEMDTLVED